MYTSLPFCFQKSFLLFLAGTSGTVPAAGAEAGAFVVDAEVLLGATFATPLSLSLSPSLSLSLSELLLLLLLLLLLSLSLSSTLHLLPELDEADATAVVASIACCILSISCSSAASCAAGDISGWLSTGFFVLFLSSLLRLLLSLSLSLLLLLCALALPVPATRLSSGAMRTLSEAGCTPELESLSELLFELLLILYRDIWSMQSDKTPKILLVPL